MGIDDESNEEMRGNTMQSHEQILIHWMVDGTYNLHELHGSSTDLITVIQDGVALCNLVNKIRPGSVSHICTEDDWGSFENFAAYFRVCHVLGVPSDTMFGIEDLCKRNTDKIICHLDCLAALSHRAQWSEERLNSNLCLTEQIGTGAYAEVWKGAWNNAQVAIKKLPASRTSMKAKIEFEEEIALAVQLQHPNVITVYGAFTVESDQWMVMEYADGGNLTNYLAGLEQDLPWSKIWKLAIDASASIAYLHDKGIIHRDIKSPNFLFVNNKLKIADFGLSTTTAFASIQTRTFENESSVGTVRWAAPETFELKPISTEKSDIYSLGMVLWELMTRKIPFGDIRSDAAVIVLVRNDKARPDIPFDCPELYYKIIKLCWSHDMEARPTAAQVHELLVNGFEEFNKRNRTG